jgi:hypothetical protein
MPLFGRQFSGSSRKQTAQLRRLDHSVYLADDYVIAMDQYHSIYYHKLDAMATTKDMDRKIASEVYNCSSFIELHPTANRIWAINSLRQLFLCQGDCFKELMQSP